MNIISSTILSFVAALTFIGCNQYEIPEVNTSSNTYTADQYPTGSGSGTVTDPGATGVTGTNGTSTSGIPGTGVNGTGTAGIGNTGVGTAGVGTTGVGTGTAGTGTVGTISNGCQLQITSPVNTTIIPFDQPFTGTIQLTNPQTNGSTDLQPLLTFDNSHNMNFTQGQNSTWNFTFNPYKVNTILELGRNTPKIIQASFIDQSGGNINCQITIELEPNDNSNVTSETSCRFLEASSLQPLLPLIKVTSNTLEFNWSQVFVIEAPQTSKPSVKMQLSIEPFEFIPQETSIVFSAEKNGWLLNVTGRTNVKHRFSVSLDGVNESCNLTVDPTLP